MVLLRTAKNDLTALDIAGYENSDECVHHYFDFVKQHMKYIKQMFRDMFEDQGNFKNEAVHMVTKKEGSIRLTHFDNDEFNDDQVSFTRMYYWASAYADFELINFFLIELGFSPFIGLHDEKTPVIASVIND